MEKMAGLLKFLKLDSENGYQLKDRPELEW